MSSGSQAQQASQRRALAIFVKCFCNIDKMIKDYSLDLATWKSGDLTSPGIQAFWL